MLAQPIEMLILNTGASAMTDIYIIAIVGIFFISLIAKRADKAHGLTQYTPTLLTSLGILGTFSGIVAGLLGFDPLDINESIGGLLEGMKTAFTTSLVGMSLSIFYKVLTSSGIVSPKDKTAVNADKVGVVELYTVMTEQVEGIKKLIQAIGGEGDSSLTSQMKLLRGDQNDNHKIAIQNSNANHQKLIESQESSHKQINELFEKNEIGFNGFQDKLWIKLQDFADMLSKSATETVIEALKEVITDFNNNLTEQFGDNFKQLNEACLELITWQEQYKQQLSDMSVKYALGVESIGATASAVDLISTQTATIPMHMEKLSHVTEVNQNQISELESHLIAFKEIRDKAVDSFPQINSHIEATLEGVKSASSILSTGILESSEKLNASLVTSSDGITKSIANSGEALTDALTNAAQSAAKGIEDNGVVMNKAIVAATDGMVSSIQETSTSIGKVFEQISSDTASAIIASTDMLKNSIIQGAEELIDNSVKVNGSLQSTSDIIMVNSEKIMTNYTDLNEEMNSNLRILVANLQDEANKITDEYQLAAKSLVEETKLSRVAFDTGLQEQRDLISKTISEMANEQATSARKVFAGLEQSIESSLGQTAEAVTKNVSYLDKALEREINSTMEQLGNSLIAITTKFTNDYSQLVDQMNRVLNKS
jgi:hypothetical protein